MAVMSGQYAQPVRLSALVVATVVAAAAMLASQPWVVPPLSDGHFWNALAALFVLGLACDSTYLKISFGGVNTSVAFIPFLAAGVLLPAPWPALVAGVTALLVDAFVRRKPMIRIVFNTAQFVLAIGAAQTAYVLLGGTPSVEFFRVDVLPFVALALVFFLANTSFVSLAVSFSSGVSVTETWARMIGGLTFAYDLVSSALAVLLAFLYVRYGFVGIAVLVIPLFFVRHIYEMNQQLEQKNREQLNLMVRAVEARDPYTSGHSVRVAEYAKAIARELGLTAKEVDDIETAALLHDVGKMYEEFVPLLRKEGKLTPEERMVMQSHPARGAELVSSSAGMRGAVEEAIKHHHENYDGSGYPEGLAGEAIPVGARIIMIADTLDAMTTDRPYRRALPFERALQELQKYSKSQFDPKLVTTVVTSHTLRRLIDGQRVFGEQVASVAKPTPGRRALSRV